MSLIPGFSTRNSNEGDGTNNDVNNGGALTRSPQISPNRYVPTPNMLFPPYEIQSHFQFLNSYSQTTGPSTHALPTSKRLIVQIGCQEANVANTTKRQPKMLKAIKDTELSVEDLVYDLLWKDVGVKQYGNLLNVQKGIITGNNTSASLTLSLGPNRSIELDVVKEKHGVVYKKVAKKEEVNGKKRKRSEGKPKSLIMQLVTSESGIVLCPRDAIYHLIEPSEEVILRPAEEGSWEYPEIPETSTNAITPALEAIANTPAASAHAPTGKQEDSPPAKRRKIDEQPLKSQQQKVASSPKRKKARTEKSGGDSGNAHTRNEQETRSKPSGNSEAKVNGKANDRTKRRKDSADENDTSNDGGDKQKSSSSKNAVKPVTQTKPKATSTDKVNDSSKASGKNASDVKNVSSSNGDKVEGQKQNKKVSQESKKTSGTGFSDRDVLIATGKGYRRHPGNLKYNAYVASKSKEYENRTNREQITAEVKSMFRFHRKEKGSETWTLLSGDSSNVSSKIKRDFQNHLKEANEKKSAGGNNAVSKKVVGKTSLLEKKTQITTSDASSRTKAEKSDEGDNPSEQNDGGSLSDETPQIEEKVVEKTKKAQTKPGKERLSDSSSDSEDSDDNENDKSPSSSSSKSNSSENSSLNKSSSDGDTDNTGQEKELKNVANSPKQEIKKARNGIKAVGKKLFAPTSVQTQKDDDSEDESENESDDDSSTSSSSVSSTSSSSVSSTSDEDSSSDDSDSSDDDNSESGSTKSNLITRDSLAKLTPQKSSNQKQQRPSTARSKRRKPLLDPSKPLVFLDTNR